MKDINHFKECDPKVTVSNLKKILNDLDIKVEEFFLPESSINTYSMRVSLDKTNFGTNGKGISEDYCMASGYAEFLERFQNDMMPIWPGVKSKKYGFYRAFDEKILSASDLVSNTNPFMDYYFQQRNMKNSSFEEKVDLLNEVNRRDYILHGLDNKFITVPFYNVRTKKVVDMPCYIYNLYYGSNGMCAGNTPSEALVQGLSEIFERVVQKRIMLEKPSLPDIPESYIEKFPIVKKMYTKLKENDKIHFYLKDGSFGGKYPVALLIVVDKNTGNFGVKLGSHPNFGIAMERCFTEAAQGQDIPEYIHSSSIDFNNANVEADHNICNSFKTGRAQWPYQLFDNENTYQFSAMPDVSNFSNEDLLKQWVKSILNEGYDLLIRDVSYSGFPSFHLIIPGLSELQNASDLTFKAKQTKIYLQDILIHPNLLSVQNVKYLISILNFYENQLIDNSIKDYYPQILSFEYPGEEISKDLLYMKAMGYAYLQNYQMASQIILNILKISEYFYPESEKTKFYRILYHYLSGMNNLNNHNKVMQYLSVFYDKELVDKINTIFSTRNSIFEEQYPCEIADNNEVYNSIDKNRQKLFDLQVFSKINQIDIKDLVD